LPGLPPGSGFDWECESPRKPPRSFIIDSPDTSDVSSIFVIFLTIITSLVAYQLAIAKRGTKRVAIRPAIRALLEWIGVFTLFLVINLTLGATVILLIRALTPQFLALYDLENPLFLILSAAQGFIFQFELKRD